MYKKMPCKRPFVISLFRWLLYDVTALLCPFGCDTDGIVIYNKLFYNTADSKVEWHWWPGRAGVDELNHLLDDINKNCPISINGMLMGQFMGMHRGSLWKSLRAVHGDHSEAVHGIAQRQFMENAQGRCFRICNPRRCRTRHWCVNTRRCPPSWCCNRRGSPAAVCLV